MIRRGAVQRERTLEMACGFVAEVRRDLERAAAAGCDLPPRLRSAHLRAGHATPEYRTLGIPIAAGAAAVSPEILSAAVARFAALRPTCAIVLAFDALTVTDDGGSCPILVAEARDVVGTRAFWMQPFRVLDGRIDWGDPAGGGWQDPGEQEMILDAAFSAGVESSPAPGARPAEAVSLPEPQPAH